MGEGSVELCSVEHLHFTCIGLGATAVELWDELRLASLLGSPFIETEKKLARESGSLVRRQSENRTE